jgi:hypothetical protein
MKTVFYKKIQLNDIDLFSPEKTEYLSREYRFKSKKEVNLFIDNKVTNILRSEL